MKIVSIILAGVILEIAVMLILLPLATPEHLQTTDFVNFYIGASIVRQDGGHHLYSREAQDAAYLSIAGYKSNQYFLHPPFEAAAFAPLTYLDMRSAYVAWMLTNVALLSCLPLVLMPCTSFVARRPQLLLLSFCFLPVLIALNTGQDAIFLLFAMSASYLLSSKGKDLPAGTVLALVAVKFQYLLFLAPLLLFARRFRLVAGLICGTTVLGVISLAVCGPAGIREYVSFLHDFNAHQGYGGLNPTLMVSARGLFAGLRFGNASTWGWVVATMLFVIASAILWRRIAADLKGLQFALAITVALLASPYAHFPDMTLMILPAVLTIDAVLAGHLHYRVLTTITSAALFVVPYILISRGRHYWWESSVYLLFLVIAAFAGSLMVELSFASKSRAQVA